MLNFGNPEPQNMGDMIPAGTLCWAVFSLREKKIAKVKDDGTGGGGYYDIELTVDSGPFTRRKVWDNISDPMDPKVSEDGRNRAFGNMKRALEASGLLNPQTAPHFANVHPDQVIQWLSSRRVAIKVGIEKGKNGYADRNRVAEYLSPNPESGSYKLFGQLINPPPAAPGGSGAAQGGFTPPAGPAPQAGGFGAPAAPQAAPGGFGQPAPAPFGQATPPAGTAAGQGGFTPSPTLAPAGATQPQPGGFGAPAPGFQVPGAEAAGPFPGSTSTPATAQAAPGMQTGHATERGAKSPSNAAQAVGMGQPGGWLGAGNPGGAPGAASGPQ